MTSPIAPEPDAETQFRRKIQEGSTNPEDYAKLAGYLFLTGSPQEAVVLYQRAIDMSPTDLQKARVSIELGWGFCHMEENTQAKMMAEAALRLLLNETNRPEVLACRGAGQTLIAQLEWGKSEEAGRMAAHNALETLEQVIGEGPTFEGKAVAYFDAAVLHGALGNSNIAITLCDKALQSGPQDWDRVSVLASYGEALSGAERFGEAQQQLEEAIKHASKYKTMLANLYLQLGITQRLSAPPTDTNQLTKAQSSFQKALLAFEADPYGHVKPNLCRDIYINFGAVCYELGDFRGAAAAYEEVLRSTPEDHHYIYEAQLYLGRCHQAEGSYREAQSYFEKVLASSHASEDQKLSARENLARSLYELREYRKASETLKELALFYPQDDVRHMGTVLWLGYCYEGLGNHERARDSYEEVIASPHALAEDQTSAMDGLRRLPPNGKQTTN